MAHSFFNQAQQCEYTVTKHQDGTMSIRGADHRIMRFLEYAARVALNMQVYAHKNRSEHLSTYEREEQAWRLMAAQIRQATNIGYCDWDGEPDPRRKLDVDDIEHLQAKLDATEG